MKFIIFAVLFAGACVAVPQVPQVPQAVTDALDGATGVATGVATGGANNGTTNGATGGSSLLPPTNDLPEALKKVLRSLLDVLPALLKTLGLDNLSKPLLGALKPVTDAIGKAPVVGGAVQAATGAV